MLRVGDAVFVEGRSVSMFVSALSRRFVFLSPVRPIPGRNWWSIGGTSAPRRDVSRIEGGRGGVRWQGTCTLVEIVRSGLAQRQTND